MWRDEDRIFVAQVLQPGNIVVKVSMFAWSIDVDFNVWCNCSVVEECKEVVLVTENSDAVRVHECASDV